MAKRGYKLQEFVAHSGNVNCLSIGKKACRLFLTGGEDNKVNVWAIGKPNSLTTLCGHTSPVDSVAFDSAETLVLGGASSGVLKLWDLEEAKMVRGLTGHRSNCTAVEFHPFGEFFASGSMDTNLKIWDIRKKGCIHTYKGHTRGISTIRFTPDGRWVVSGGYDNIVKVWDLTAGKLLHDFKFHENHIRTIEFHPLEFLLATGSADRTVKFWDLETFELIGSTRPEGTSVRAIAFNPDGRTLFCGLDDSMKVYSWEPIICHDSIEMGWSTLSDLCIHEGKLLGCSYYQNSVGVWVSDVSLIGPNGTNWVSPHKDNNQHGFNLQKSSSGKKESQERSMSSLRYASPDHETKEIKNIYVDTANGNPVSSQRNDSLSSPKIILADSPDTASLMVKKHGTSAKNSPEKSRGQVSLKSFSATDSHSQEILEIKDSSAPQRESITFSRTKPGMLLKPAHRRRHSSAKIDSDGLSSITDMKNVSEAKNSSDSFDSMLPNYSSHRRRLSNAKFDIENLSDPSEARSFSESRIDFNGPLETDIKNVPEAHGESIQEECSDIKGVPEKVSPQTTKDDSRDETLGSSRQEIASVKIVRGVAVVSGRTRTLVEKFERREGLNEGEDKAVVTVTPQQPTTDKSKLIVPAESKETINNGSYQSLDGPSNLISASSQTPAAVCPSERREEMCNNTIEQSTCPSNIISARRQIPAADCPSETRKEMCNNTREQATAQPTPCMEPSRSKMPPTLISTTDKVEPQNSNDQETTVFHEVLVLPKDESSNSPERESGRRTRLNMKQDKGGVVVPNVVPRRERTSINQASSSERKQRVSREDQSVTIVSPNVALRRDRLSINQVGRPERRERNNIKEDQPTRVSSHVVPSRERTPPTLGGNIRRERLTHPEVQATNHVLPVIEKNIEAIGCFEGRERFHADMESQESNMPLRTISVIDKMATELVAEPESFVGKPNPADEKDVAEVLMETHEVFLSTLRSRLTKLQVIRHFFGRNDVKGAIDAIRKLPDHAVQADFISILMEKMEMLNLDLFSSLLPVLVGLLDSKFERHTSLSLELLLKLVAVFGSLVFNTISAPPTVGVDLHAEQRRECCHQCFAQLQKIKKILPLLVRRGGVVTRCAQELNLVLQQS